MRITFTREHKLYGAVYRPGEEIDLPQEAAERLLRDRVARIDPQEILRYYKRGTTPAGRTDMLFR